MYYYGYSGGYGNTNPCCQSYMPAYGYGGSNYGCGGAFILVLFILLVIVFGAGFLNYGNN